MDEQKLNTCPAGNAAADLTANQTSDFDMFDPEYNANPGPIWREMRETCPFSRSEERGGAGEEKTKTLKLNLCRQP